MSKTDKQTIFGALAPHYYAVGSQSSPAVPREEADPNRLAAIPQLAAGASEIELQKLGRWNHPQSVRRYTKIDVERVRAGINKVGNSAGRNVGKQS
jgi:hypothetical protein